MAAATYPPEADATKALDYQSVIALAQPDRVNGDPVSGHPEILAETFVRYDLCAMFGQHIWTWPKNGKKPSPTRPCSCGEMLFGERPAPPAVTHTGP